MTPPFPPLPLFFVAFCRFLLTNAAICRMQSIAHYTLHSAKRVRGDSPRPLSRRAHLYSTRLSVRPAELSPTGFRHRPQGRFKPSGTMSVGADFLPRQSKQSMVAMPLFCKQKSKPLTACFQGVVFRNHRRNNVQRACSRHEPTQGF